MDYYFYRQIYIIRMLIRKLCILFFLGLYYLLKNIIFIKKFDSSFISKIFIYTLKITIW